MAQQFSISLSSLQPVRQLMRPPKVRILIYSDGSVSFKGIGFEGLQYASLLLKSRAYPLVDFAVTTAHRNGDDFSTSIAGKQKLTDLDILKKYDQIWFFSKKNKLDLSSAETAMLNKFKASPKFGGFFVTDNAAELDKGCAWLIDRADELLHNRIFKRQANAAKKVEMANS
jgi:hypothetical protein